VSTARVLTFPRWNFFGAIGLRRAEVVAFALVVLLVIAIVTVLYFAKGLLPSRRDGVRGGTMLSPILIVGLILKEHLMPVDAPQLPPD
jgi:hypothetical protein